MPTIRSGYAPRRGSDRERGYGYAHKKRRRRVAEFVATGMARCARGHDCERAERINGSLAGGLIRPDEPWDLDHSDDRASYLGPSHARCNRRAGGSQ